MARTFVAASSQKIIFAGTPVTGVPLTMAAWWKPVSAAVSSVIDNITTAGGGDCFRIDQNSSGRILASCAQSNVLTTAISTAGVTAGAWNHACAVFATNSDRRAFCNGGNKGTDATAKTPAGVSQLEIGHDTAASLFANGDIADCAIWNIALSDAEVALLATGIPAWAVQPQALVSYRRLLEGFSPEIDIMAARTGTLTNAPAVAPHPPIRY